MSDRDDVVYDSEVHPTENGAEMKYVEHNGQNLIVGSDGKNPVSPHNPDPRAVIGHADAGWRTTDPFIPGVDHDEDDVMTEEEAAENAAEHKDGEKDFSSFADADNPGHVATDVGAGAESDADTARGAGLKADDGESDKDANAKVVADKGAKTDKDTKAAKSGSE